jgi:SAM-dependent methyltransferase
VSAGPSGFGTYAFRHAWELEHRRLELVQEVYDPGTIRHLEALGVGPGWRCLEVGGGAGSITRWLCQRVGPSGTVVATDVETDFLEQLDEPNLEVRRHDITVDDLEDGAYDLVHSRMVLQHLPEREQALERMAAALAPGGVLIEEGLDCGSLVAGPAPDSAFFDDANRRLMDLMAKAGYDPDYGRTIAAALLGAGLGDVGAEGRVAVGLHRTAAAEMWRLTVECFRDRLTGAGVLSDDEIDRLGAFHDDETFSFLYPTMIAAWGLRMPSIS